MKYLLMFTTLLSVSTFAQESQPLPNKPGTYTYSYKVDEHSAGFKITATEAAAFKQNVSTLVEILHQHSVLTKPLGFDAVVKARPLYPHNYSWHKQNYGIVGDVQIDFCEWSSLNGKEQKQTIEPSYAKITINDFASTIKGERNNFTLDGYVDEIDKAATYLNDFFSLPAKLKELDNGVILYANNIIIVGKENIPYWVPVTMKEYFDALTVYYNARAKKTDLDAPVFDLVKKEMNALSEAEKAGPAYGASENISGITAEKNAFPIMKFNPAYFNRNLPRSSIQLITLENPSNNSLSIDESMLPQSEVGFLRVHQLLNSLDTKKLKGLIQQ